MHISSYILELMISLRRRNIIIHSHFNAIMKKGAPCSKTINWASIPPADLDLSALGDPIPEDEVRAAVLSLPLSLPSD